MSPYEAHARTSMGWTGGNLKKENPKVYALAKARVLALGYQAGFKKFIFMVGMYGITAEEVFSDPITQKDVIAFGEWNARFPKGLETLKEYSKLDDATKIVWVNALKQVLNFRESSPKIVALWNQLGSTVKALGPKREDYEVELPSGRSLRYTSLSGVDEVRGFTQINGIPVKLYGGLITENIVQATARDVFMEGVWRVENAGYQVVATIHDEAIVEVDKDVSIETIVGLMSVTPKWLTGCPVAAEGEESEFYKK